jgi:hypothetical protein
MINRSVMIIKVKGPFLNWLRSLPDPEDNVTLVEINSDGTIYLIPPYEMDYERKRILENYYDIVFENELAEWWTNPDDWPKRRDLEIFKEWFDIEFRSLVEDLVDLPIEYE